MKVLIYFGIIVSSVSALGQTCTSDKNGINISAGTIYVCPLGSLTGGGTSLPGAVSATNPATGSDPNNRRMVDFTCTTDATTSNPNFSDENCFQLTENSTNGQALFGNGTNAKKTFELLLNTANFQGSGQKILRSEGINSYGMSDTALASEQVTFAGGPIAGDEGQNFVVVSTLQQQPHLNQATLSSSTRTTCNTTLTQAVTASRTAQTVTVASTTGCNANDWVVVGQEAPTATPNESPMQITGVGVGTLTGVIVGNYANGVTITPATVLNTGGDGFPWGQDRMVVDLTSTPFTTGAVSSIAGGGFTGTGTGWSAGMVGGNSTVVGCIALTNDDFNGSPFGGSGENGNLKSWYQIVGPVTSTGLGVMTTSTAGDSAYHGNGVGAGAYMIRPCAKVLRVNANSNQAILETNSFTWTAGDSLEEAVTPYPDSTGFEYRMAQYTPGGVRRAFYDLRNTGARTIQIGINLQGNMAAGANADTVPFGTAFASDVTSVGFSLGEVRTGLAVRTTATATTGGSQTPCYGFQGLNLFNPSGGTGGGSALGTGWCADGNSGLPFINIGPVKVTNAQGSSGVSADLPNALKTTATLTYTSISAQTCQEQTATVTGATSTMLAQASPQASLGTVNLSWCAWVSAAGTVSIRVCNPSSGSITPNAVTWNVAALIL